MRKKGKLIFGKGVNDVDESTITLVDGKRVVSPFYRTWFNMLNRCYNPKLHKIQKTYIDCSVCEHWLYFSNFKAWMEKQEWNGKVLDKDLLVGGNKIYSPQTSLFIQASVNTSLILRGNDRGENPLGCNFHKKSRSYRAYCSDGKGKPDHLGLYKTPMEAHRVWQLAKIKILDALKDTQPDFLVKIGLQRVIDKIQDDYDNNRETKDFN